jgi:pimeloyl-ACP methyl ester carboxylesterase
VLIEPFLLPMEIWALREIYDQLIPQGHALLRAMADDYFGLYSGGRDFRPLQRFAPRRTLVLVGEKPLEPPRPMVGLPSFVSAKERASWAAAGAEVRVCPGAGHAIPDEAPELVVQALRDALAIEGGA